MKDIVDDIESYHRSKYYKSGGVKNDRFFNETKEDDSVGQATTVSEFTAFQSQPTSVASHIGSPPVNNNNINSINGNTNTTNTLPGVTGLDMQRMIDEIALQRTTSNTIGNNYNYNYGIIGFDANNTGKSCENIKASLVKHDDVSEDKNKAIVHFFMI